MSTFDLIFLTSHENSNHGRENYWKYGVQIPALEGKIFDCELVSQSYKPLFFFIFSSANPQFSLFLNFRYFHELSLQFLNGLTFISIFKLNFHLHLYGLFCTKMVIFIFKLDFHFLFGFSFAFVIGFLFLFLTLHLELFPFCNWIFFPILKCIFLPFSNWTFFSNF